MSSSSSPFNTFYYNMNFDSYSTTKPLLLGDINPAGFQDSSITSEEHSPLECNAYKEKTNCIAAVNKLDIFSPYSIKIEQQDNEGHQQYIENSHHYYLPTIASMNDNNNSHLQQQYNTPLIDSYNNNSNIYQKFSPCLSYSTQSPLAFCYDDNNKATATLDYFMSSASPTASYSLSPPLTTASPEAQNIGLYYCDTLEDANNRYYDYNHYTALDYPLVEAETVASPLCYNSNNSADDCFSTATTINNFSLDEDNDSNNNDNGTNLGFMENNNKKRRRKSAESSANLIATVSSNTNSKTNGNRSDKKMYPCNYCNRSFARKYDVARHKRIHTGSKPYVCPCCLKGFSRSDARVRHFRTEIACRDGTDKLGRHRTQKSNSSIL